MSDDWVWDRYWRFDRIASCLDGAGKANYAGCIADGWRAFFAALPDGARIIDLCTGNGAVALIAAETARRSGRRLETDAVDRAAIDPAAFVTGHDEDFAAIRFHAGTEAESLPFPAACFDAAVSQYGIEYSDLDRALPELARVIAPGGQVRLVVHAADGAVVADTKPVIAEADLLLDDIDLVGAARRCFIALAPVEREHDDSPAAQAQARAALAAFQAAMARTAERAKRAADPIMVRNTGAVLYDTFQRRGRFEQAAILAKVDAIETEIRAHRGRLAALVAAAKDRAGAEAIAARLIALGAKAAERSDVRDGGDLIGHAISARF